MHDFLFPLSAVQLAWMSRAAVATGNENNIYFWLIDSLFCRQRAIFCSIEFEKMSVVFEVGKCSGFVSKIFIEYNCPN